MFVDFFTLHRWQRLPGVESQSRKLLSAGCYHRGNDGLRPADSCGAPGLPVGRQRLLLAGRAGELRRGVHVNAGNLVPSWEMNRAAVQLWAIFKFNYELYSSTTTSIIQVPLRAIFKFNYELYSITTTSYIQVQLQALFKYNYKLNSSTTTSYVQVQLRAILKFNYELYSNTITSYIQVQLRAIFKNNYELNSSTTTRYIQVKLRSTSKYN